MPQISFLVHWIFLFPFSILVNPTVFQSIRSPNFCCYALQDTRCRESRCFFSHLVPKLFLLKVLSTLPLLDHRLIRTNATSEPKRFISCIEILRAVNQMWIAGCQVAAQHLISAQGEVRTQGGENVPRYQVPGGGSRWSEQ